MTSRQADAIWHSTQPVGTFPAGTGIGARPPQHGRGGAISAVRPGGRVVVVGLGRNEATISTTELVYKSVTLRGSRGGQPGALESVLDLMANGDLTIHATRIGFDEIPDAIERLKSGHVVGRIAAVMPDD